MTKKSQSPHPEESKIPLPPPGVSKRMWETSQLSLIAKGVPPDMVYRIRSLRQINLWVWLVIIMGHEWRWVADNEHILIRKDFKRKPGQA